MKQDSKKIMDNPYQLIGISFLMSIAGIFALFEAPNLLLQFDQSEWLMVMLAAGLACVSYLCQLLFTTQKLYQKSTKNSH
ncbi:MAG: hypothetical protein WC716_01270 [Chitinophagaceae bacterium]|jgi:hypothetical protein